MHYLALIGDIVDSKQLRQRGEFQTKLTACLKSVGNRNATLVSPYTITLGDEFQAVYKNADRLWLDLFSIMRDIHPVEARFAIGVGPLSTEVNRKQALGMDGPAFHRARAGINELKETGHLIRLQGEPVDEKAGLNPWHVFNRVLNLLSHRIASWEENRFRILCGLLAGQAVGDIGEELAISKVAVYKNINAAALDEIQALCQEMTRFLNRELKNP